MIETSRAYLRGAAIAAIVASFVVFGLTARSALGVLRAPEHRRRRFSARLLGTYCRWLCRVSGIRVRAIGDLDSLRDSSAPPRLVVANHLGYLDVWVLSSLFPSLYITSVEVAETPVLGTVCRAAGCVFVERRKRSAVAGELDAFGDALTAGAHWTLFPEGTSSNGEAVLPFKKSLFAAAERAGAPIQPICLRYRSVGGREIDRQSRDSVFYYGDMTFGAHFSRFLRAGEVEVEVEILPLIPAGVSRKSAADEARQKIIAAYGAPTF